MNLASGNLEGIRSGGRALREGARPKCPPRSGYVEHGAPGGETILEGEAGFYHAYTGNNLGVLRYSFTADNKTDLGKINENLGQD